MGYADEWYEAVARTAKYGLEVGEGSALVDQLYLAEQRKDEFPYIIRDNLGFLQPEDIVAQCIKIHWLLAPVFRNWLKCPVTYTIGWIDDNSTHGLFKFDEDFILNRLNNPKLGGVVNVHTWLTLPSLEIIDISLASTIAHTQKKPELYGSILAGHADSFTSMSYKPMLIGEGFLLKSGLIGFEYS